MAGLSKDFALLQGRNAAIIAPSGGATIGPQQNFPGAGLETTSPSAALAAPVLGQAKTPVIDVRGDKNISLMGAFYKTQATGFAATAPAGSWGMEVSTDGNLFTKIGTNVGGTVPAAETISVESEAVLQVTNNPFAYIQGRFIYSGAVAGLGTLVTAPTPAAGNGQCICMSPDGLFIFIGIASTGFLAAYPVSPTTGICSGTPVVPGVAIGGAVAGIDCIGPFGGLYFVALAFATTSPFAGVIPFTTAGVFGAFIGVPTAQAAAGLSCKWAPNNASNPTNQVLIVGATGSWGGYSFNATSAQFVSTLNLLTDMNGVAVTQPGANINALAFSADGSLLFTAESTTPYLHMYPFNAANAKPLSAPAANPSVLPGGATTAVAVHPSGEGVVYVVTTAVLAYPIFRNAAGSPFAAAKLPMWGPQKSNAVAGGTIVALAFDPSGAFLLTGGGTTPFVTLYPWADIVTGLGTLFTAISAGNIPAGVVRGVCFHPNGGWAYATHTTTPFLIGWPITPACEIFAKIVAKSD